MWKEFKEFATKGNVMDLAIGVIIGGAFQSIVNSLVNDVIMPAVSVVTGKIDYHNLVLNIGNSSIRYGSFITNVINFLIIAFSVFLMVRYFNKINKTLEEKAKNFNKKLEKQPSFFKIKKKNIKKDTPKPTTKVCPFCLSEINIHALRCPHCTSVLNTNINNDVIEEQLKIDNT